MSTNFNNIYGNKWGTKRSYLSAMLSHTVGMNAIVFLPHSAVSWGAAGHIIVIFVTFIVIGIPLLYMENVVGQFTGRDCIEVWHARPCFSHLGYIYLIWQFAVVIYLQTINSFLIHYFLISFENPIPFYFCGNWSQPNCNILNHNYTVNEDCLKQKEPQPYCTVLCRTFPEYQYWRFYILGLDKEYYYHHWRIGLGSGVLAIIIFLSCFKGPRSLKWMFWIVTIFPMSGRFVFMIGSMLQKGIVVKYEEALDCDFKLFSQHFSLSNSIAEVMFTLNVGTGLAFSVSSRASFRAPCYSNTVIVVAITASLVILGIFSTVMMTCPHTFKYGIRPNIIMSYPIANIFEKIPLLLHSYETPSVWLILCFGFIVVSTTGITVSIISCCIEIMAKRYPKVGRNTGLTAFIISVILYIGIAPLLSNMTFYFMVDMKRSIHILIVFMSMLENVVFVLWYGVERFSEDVHFMQGIQPNATVKACWFTTSFILLYVFISQMLDLYRVRKNTSGSHVGWYVLLTILFMAVFVTLIRLLVAAYKKKLYDEVSLDTNWGPKSELLRRSRAMFTAQAMTKEYMYRQYHLQAGIQMRQKTSNVRACYRMKFDKK